MNLIRRPKKLIVTKELTITDVRKELSTKFRQEHKKYLGFSYMGSIASKGIKKQNQHNKIIKDFILIREKHAINLDDYFKWFFEIKIKQLKSAQFYFSISHFMLSDYLLYLKHQKSFESLEQGSKVNKHQDIQQEYFTLNQIPSDLIESKKRQQLGSFIYANNLKINDQIIIRGQVKDRQKLSDQDKIYITKLLETNPTAFLRNFWS